MAVHSLKRRCNPIYGLAVSAAVAATVLLAGCAGVLGGVVKAYPGPERPASEISVIECGFSLAILAIDGDPRFSGKPIMCRFALLPGRHTFRVRIENSWVQKGDQVVDYELMAGKKYSLHAFEDQKAPGLWVIKVADPATNKIIPIKEVRRQ